LNYAAKYKNIQIEDGLAREWGEHEVQYKLSLEAPPASWSGNGLHVLRRQSDGSWKFAVTILDDPYQQRKTE
jgi:ketosteroid isomerase-like protein